LREKTVIGRARTLIALTACSLAMPVFAQAPAPTTMQFDGTYFGVSLTLEETWNGRSWTRGCRLPGQPGPLTIVSGIARNFGSEGSVSPQGVLTMRAPNADLFRSTVTAPSRDVGNLIATCKSCQKAPESTTAFDGNYYGISREVSTTSVPGARCPPNGVPAALTIQHGTVRSNEGSWQGMVSPQGALGMRNGKSTQLDGQVDGQGNIWGQATNASGCTITFVWRKQSG
jgi:hypothetical protein